MKLTKRGWVVVDILTILILIGVSVLVNHFIPWDAVWVPTKG